MSEFGAISCNTFLVFGTSDDRVIEAVGRTRNGKRTFEIGLYDGPDKKKLIINISSADGCHVGCNFCELIETGAQLSVDEMFSEVATMLAVAKKVDGYDIRQKPLKVNVAKTGEPILNRNLVAALKRINQQFPKTSFKLSTSAPDVPFLLDRVRDWAVFAAAHHEGSTQLTVSLISTDEKFRRDSAKGKLASLQQISQMVDIWHSNNPHGRTPNCSLLLGKETPCDPRHILSVLPPERVKIRIRPIVPTQHSLASGMQSIAPARIADILADFRSCGYDINDAGVPTGTEIEHGLASNVTRGRNARRPYPKGIYYVQNGADINNPRLIPIDAGPT